jgi:hypothetical protein
MLEAALAYYQEFIEQRQEDPGAQKELEITRDRVKKIIGDLAILQGPGPLFLVGHPGVLDDLGLSQEKRGRVRGLLRRLVEQRNSSLGQFHHLNGAQRRERFLTLARAEEAAIATVLSPGQIGRVRQIVLQLAGPRAFRQPDVVAALRLTAEQQERIRAIEKEVFPVRMHWHVPGEPSEPLPRRPPGQGRQQRHKVARDRILAVLTGEQKAKWEELTGKPFTGEMPARVGGRAGVIGGFGPP